MKAVFNKIFLLALFILASLHSRPAEAALGDFLYKWGVNYEFGSPRGIAADSAGNVYVAAGYGVYVFDITGKFLRSLGAGGSGEGQFNNAQCVAVDSNGNVYVADAGNARVQVFSSTGSFLRKWGAWGSGDGQFVNPYGIAVDESGNVYVADMYNHRIQVFTNTGMFLRKWGAQGSGDGQFSYPWSIAVGEDGNVYVADSNNHRVQVFSQTGAFLRKIGTYGFGDGQLYRPQGVAVDSSGNVLVADSANHRVQVFSNAGTFLKKWSTYGSSSFSAPQRIAADSLGNIFVTDHRVQVFSSAGALLTQWGQYDSGDGGFSYPRAIAADSSGNLYVVDNNMRLQVFSNTGQSIRKWGSYGTGAGQFSYPSGVAVGTTGNVYIADSYNRRVQVFSNTGEFLRIIGSWGSGDGQFSFPQGIAVDSNENIYVTDNVANRVQVFSSTGIFLRKWGSYGSGVGQFQHPQGIAVDSNGDVYVTDVGRVQVFSSTGAFLRKWGSLGDGNGQFNSYYRIPYGIAADSRGNIYVADRVGKVQVFTSTGIFLGKWGSQGSGDGQLLQPHGVAVDGNGKVFVADTSNHRIQVFSGYKTCTLTANAGADQTVEQTSPAGASVTLQGSGTSEGCASSSTYEWTWSGGSATSANPTVSLPPGTTNLTLTVSSGSQSATDSVAVTVQDTQPPSTTPFVIGSLGENGWFVSDVTVSLAASDSGSGVKEIRYDVDGAVTVAAGDAVAFTISADGIHGGSYHAVDNADNKEAPHPFTLAIDQAPPAISISGVADGGVYLLGAAPTPSFSVSDNLSGVAAQSAKMTGGNASGLGTYAYTVNAADKAGNTASASAVYSVVYGFSGFLPPVSLEKPFKLGSTMPVKFQLTDAGGAYIPNAVATLAIQKYSGDQAVGDPIEVVSTSGADIGNTFRYSAVDSLYIFNLSTDGLSEGTWQIRATLDDGTGKTAFLVLKAK